ncbi:amidase enhancer precursor [bacterium BMS3Abin07]|nr:amidase enhancer precursor [bacterium BMS3Abin07]GBE31506.1 amidase enhancer precursor [bacterium BMS3Bbin05]HDL19905.1 SpoIID/LytB domain-containing protein [Nitrospirota bacterium]HDO22581.1 SpoIID/LytB domain-containing protein [Nitrospirota bacterium]HDZ87085.1 SpoIID/LytB domain-containing protein [Nitrospirota bacterium]
MKHSLISKRTILTLFIIPISLLCFGTYSFALSVRVLILDNKYKSIPKLDDTRKIGNINGKLLFKGIQYSGKIEIFKSDQGLFVVNELPLEEYVKGVVKVETGKNWPIEALKAQAVASRTYAIYNMRHRNGSIYDLASSTLSQMYRGVKSDPDVDIAVNATKGEILTYNGAPIDALYHSTSGGVTEFPEEVFGKSFPYLTSVKTDCTASPYYIWERRISRDILQNSLDIKNINNIEVISRTRTGRAKELRIDTSEDSVVITATKFRKAVGWKRLPSTWFSISVNGNLFAFSGRGYGHGVGMCQWSAMEMAKKGVNYKKILATFYPGTVIELYEDK